MRPVDRDELLSVVDQLMGVIEESRALTLAVMEHLAVKTQRVGAPPRVEPILSEAEAKAVFARAQGIRRQLYETRKKAEREASSRLALPPGV